MKHLSLLVAGLAVAGALLAIAYGPAPKPPAVQVTSQGPTVERLARLMHLVTTRVYIADVLTAEGEGYRGAWLIKGDALIGVNLRQRRSPRRIFRPGGPPFACRRRRSCSRGWTTSGRGPGRSARPLGSSGAAIQTRCVTR